VLTRSAAAAAALALLAGGAEAAVDHPDAATRSTTAGAEGIGDPYFPLDGNGGIDVRSYDVHDGYRFSDRRVRGWTTVTLRTTERLSSFDLDFLLPVSSVRLSTGAATFSRPYPSFAIFASRQGPSSTARSSSAIRAVVRAMTFWQGGSGRRPPNAGADRSSSPSTSSIRMGGRSSRGRLPNAVRALWA